MIKSRTPSRRKAADPAVTVHLPESMLRSIDRLAHRGQITRSEVIRRLVQKALADDVPLLPMKHSAA